jgi:hypothetical protein
LQLADHGVVPLIKVSEMVTPVFFVLPVTMCWRPMREVVTWLIQTFELPSRAMAG